MKGFTVIKKDITIDFFYKRNRSQKKLYFSEFVQKGFTNKFVNFLNTNKAVYPEFIELLKNPEVPLKKVKYFTFKDLPDELVDIEIAEIMFEKELKEIGSNKEVLSIIKNFTLFCEKKLFPLPLNLYFRIFFT